MANHASNTATGGCDDKYRRTAYIHQCRSIHDAFNHGKQDNAPGAQVSPVFSGGRPPVATRSRLLFASCRHSVPSTIRCLSVVYQLRFAALSACIVKLVSEFRMLLIVVCYFIV